MPKNITVVDDDEQLNDVLHYNLSREGYRVRQVFAGDEAIDAISEEPPDLVLLDVMLPGADGWEVCRHLTSSASLRGIPVIIFTAKSAREDFDTAREFDVAGYFVKPYATADVLRHVAKVLAARRHEGAGVFAS